jgi:transcriptional regulator with XRE-family HTH domain
MNDNFEMGFVEWLDGELNKRDWTRADLSRRAKVSQSSLSLIYSGARNPGESIARSIAHAFGLPESVVFQAAGLMTNDPEPAPGQDEMAYIYAHLPPDRQEQLREYARFLLDQQERSAQPKTRTADV